MTDSKPIEHMINEVNRLINNAFLRCRYGVYAFDSSTETIRHTHNGIECNFRSKILTIGPNIAYAQFRQSLIHVFQNRI